MIVVPSFSLEYNFVCFIDILGFSKMVKHDCESPKGNEKFIEKLYKVHNNTITLQTATNTNLQVIQFSDSVVISTPYSCICDEFEAFLNIISRYQYELFKEHILCRGGIAEYFSHSEPLIR